MKVSRAGRLAARGFGRRAEAAALALLILKGYRILARRYLAPGGEIDLIAMRRDTILFVEVKARPNLACAQTAISEEKRRRVSKAARFWISRHRAPRDLTLRGDAVFVAPWRVPKHVVGAFLLDLD